MTIDTNVLVAALRSRRGASFRLLSLIGQGRFDIVLSVALVLEYEEVLLRNRDNFGLTEQDVHVILDYLCSVAHHQTIFFLWRPQLRDPADEMVLELAANSESDAIVTFNTRHFEGVERFGLQLLTPREFLATIGESR